MLNFLGQWQREWDNDIKAKSKSTTPEDDSNSQRNLIARREFPAEIDDDARMRIKLMVKAELERNLARDEEPNREAGELRDVQVLSSGVFVLWRFERLLEVHQS